MADEMRDRVVLVFKFNDQVYVRIMGGGDTFDNLVDSLCSHWTCLMKDGVLLYYDLPGIPRCPILCDYDLKTMYDVACMDKVSRISVYVHVKNTDIPSSSNGSSSVTRTDEMDLSDLEQDNTGMDMLASFCPRKDKVLMSVGWDKYINSEGQSFEGGAAEFRLAIRKYSLECGFKISFRKNNFKRVTAVCASTEGSTCKWLVHGTREAANGFFYIRRLVNVHSCDFLSRDFRGKRMTADLVAELVEDNVRVDTSIGPKQVQTIMKINYGFEVSYAVCCNGLKKAKFKAFGPLEDSFRALNWYVEKLLETNPGSRVDLQVSPETNKFERIFIAYDACIKGFNHCRPVIALDGAHLKAATRGCILAATGKNANQEIYPICFVVVQAENVDNWAWFLQNLKTILDPDRRITFITDRHQGLLENLPIVFPDSPHSYCYHHLEMNLRDKCSNRKCSSELRDELCHFFMKCAYAPNAYRFNYWMKKFLHKGGKIARAFLADLPPEKWSNAYFPGMRYGDMCSNVAESFNNWILKERSVLVTDMVDRIRVKLMKMLTKRRDASNEWESVVGPSSITRIGDFIQESRTWEVIKSSDDVFEVQCDYTVSVNLHTRSCSCGSWQISRFPCKHVVASILHKRASIFSYVDPVFSKTQYQLANKEAIYPIPMIEKPDFREEESNINDILPPDCKRGPGRPRKARKRCRGELTRPLTCSSCNRVGHNMRTCPGRFTSS